MEHHSASSLESLSLQILIQEKKKDYIPSELLKHYYVISTYSYLHIFIWMDTRNSVTLPDFGKRIWMIERYPFCIFLNFKTFQK